MVGFRIVWSFTSMGMIVIAPYIRELAQRKKKKHGRVGRKRRRRNLPVNVDEVKMRHTLELTGGRVSRLPEKILSTVRSSIASLGRGNLHPAHTQRRSFHTRRVTLLVLTYI